MTNSNLNFFLFCLAIKFENSVKQLTFFYYDQFKFRITVLITLIFGRK